MSAKVQPPVDDELIRRCPMCQEQTAVCLGRDDRTAVYVCGLCDHEFELDVGA